MNLRAWMLATLGGAIIVYGAGWLPLPGHTVALVVAGLVLAVAALALKRSPPGKGPVRAVGVGCILASGMLGGIAWTGGHAYNRLADPFPVALEKVPLQVSGYTCSVPAWGAWSSVRQDFCVTQWHGVAPSSDAGVESGLGAAVERLPLPAKLRLARYNADSRFTLAGPAMLEVSLKRPHGNVNQDGFRYETWLYRQGYLATGSIRKVLSPARDRSSPVAELRLASKLDCGWVCRYHRLRADLVQELNEKAAGMRQLALVESLFLGSRGRLGPEDWNILQATGTSHLLAISGLHVGLIAAMVGFLVRAFLLRVIGDRYGPALVPATTFVLVCLAAAAYALLAGFTVPTQRALVMVVIAGLLMLKGMTRQAWAGWLLAAFLVLVLDPFAILDVGFWLSFGAVACLILAFGSRLASPSAWRNLVLAQVAITLGLWPILVALGMPVAPLGFVANLFAIPWLSLMVMPVLVLAMPLILFSSGWPGDWASAVLDAVLSVLWWVLAHLAVIAEGWAGAVPPLSAWLLALVVGAGFLALLPVGRLYRLSAVSLTGVLLFRLATTPAANAASIHPELIVLDVGQGLAVLIRDGSSAMLYDTGPAGNNYSAAEAQILPSLAAVGVRRLDLLVLSHADNDHAGAWEEVARVLTPGEVISGEPEALSPTVLPCSFADGRTIGRWTLRAWQAAAQRTGDGNDRSCVVEAVYGRYRVALTGDIGTEQEQAWLRTRERAPVDLLVAPHHGSASSSGRAFVANLKPVYTVFSAGYRNRYGHPHPDVLARYSAVGSEVLTTPDTGALTFTFSPQQLSYQAERDRASFWIRARSSFPH